MALPARRGARSRRSLQWCARVRRGRHPVRRRDERRRRRRARAPASARRSRSTSAALDRVLEVDPVSRAARIQGGARGPAPRAAAQAARPDAAPLPAVASSSRRSAAGSRRAPAVTSRRPDAHRRPRRVGPRGHAAAGVWESRRLPGSGAGPSPDRLLLGSEGIARRHHRGVDARAGRARPTARRRRCASPTSTRGPRRCARSSQSGSAPDNCRLIDPVEARTTGAGDGSAALLVLGFESADHELGPWIDRALAICTEHGGVSDEVRGGGREGAAGAWRDAFLRAAVPARRVRRGGRDQRHVRDLDHVGSLSGVPRARSRPPSRKRCATSAAPAR